MKVLKIAAVMALFVNSANASWVCQSLDGDVANMNIQNITTRVGEAAGAATVELQYKDGTKTFYNGYRQSDMGYLYSKISIELEPTGAGLVELAARPRSCGRRTGCDTSAELSWSAKLQQNNSVQYFSCYEAVP